jgi:hypothetical protein
MRLLHLLAALAACNAPDAPGPDDATARRRAPIEPGITEAEYCREYARAWCETFTPCCHEAGFEASADRCERAAQRDCDYKRTQRVAAGLAYQPASAQACLAGFAQITRDCRTRSVDDPERPVETIEACRQIWTGATPLGGACHASRECAAAGEPVECAFSGADGYTGVCRRVADGVAGLDERCGSPVDGSPTLTCSDGLWCALTTGFEGRCAAPGGPQARCTPGDHASCRDGLDCDPSSRRCLPLRPVGAACGSDQPACASDTYCDGARCEPLRREGEACSDRRGERCATALTCRDEHCMPRLDDGRACETATDCASGACTNGRCGGFEVSVATPGTCSIANGVAHVPHNFLEGHY